MYIKIEFETLEEIDKYIIKGDIIVPIYELVDKYGYVIVCDDGKCVGGAQVKHVDFCTKRNRKKVLSKFEFPITIRGNN
jgi:hypothetical protein